MAKQSSSVLSRPGLVSCKGASGGAGVLHLLSGQAAAEKGIEQWGLRCLSPFLGLALSSTYVLVIYSVYLLFCHREFTNHLSFLITIRFGALVTGCFPWKTNQFCWLAPGGWKKPSKDDGDQFHISYQVRWCPGFPHRHGRERSSGCSCRG